MRGCGQSQSRLLEVVGDRPGPACTGSAQTPSWGSTPLVKPPEQCEVTAEELMKRLEGEGSETTDDDPPAGGTDDDVIIGDPPPLNARRHTMPHALSAQR